MDDREYTTLPYSHWINIALDITTEWISYDLEDTYELFGEQKKDCNGRIKL